MKDRTGLADHVGRSVRVRGTLVRTARLAPPFVVALLREVFISLPAGGYLALDHVWVRRADLLVAYPAGAEIACTALAEAYRRSGDTATEYGLTRPRDVQSLPLPPALRVGRGARAATANSRHAANLPSTEAQA
jgi:hypothetical protein